MNMPDETLDEYLAVIDETWTRTLRDVRALHLDMTESEMQAIRAEIITVLVEGYDLQRPAAEQIARDAIKLPAAPAAELH